MRVVYQKTSKPMSPAVPDQLQQDSKIQFKVDVKKNKSAKFYSFKPNKKTVDLEVQMIEDIIKMRAEQRMKSQS
jgi:hypothetical protein